MAELRVIEQTAKVIDLVVETSGGPVVIVAYLRWFPNSKELVFDQADVDGIGPGALGRTGLNEVELALAKFGGQYGAEVVIVQGGRRTTGRYKGRIPSKIFIPCL